MQRPYRQELKVRKKVLSHFNKQYKFVKETWRELYDDLAMWYYTSYGKTYNRETSKELTRKFETMEEYWDLMWLEDMIEDIKPEVEKAVIIGYKQSYNTHSEWLDKVGISFNLKNPIVEEYMNEFDDLQLSDYRGSVSYTTKNWVIRELRRWIKEGLSYTEIGENIEALDKTLFSKSRAKLIAANETGRAFEVWNYIPMEEAARQWVKVIKKWLTVNDDRVTVECSANQNVGWINLDNVYESWDKISPRKSNPRCRCTMQYYFKDYEGIDTSRWYKEEDVHEWIKLTIDLLDKEEESWHFENEYRHWIWPKKALEDYWIDKNEYAAMYRYSWWVYKPMNDFLRGVRKFDAEDTRTLISENRILRSWFEKLPDSRSAYSYRGILCKVDEFDEIFVKDWIVSDLWYTSTSISEEVAKKFLSPDEQDFQNNVMLVFNWSWYWKDFSKVSKYGIEEAEVLVRPGAKFKVVWDRMVQSYWEWEIWYREIILEYIWEKTVIVNNGLYMELLWLQDEGWHETLLSDYNE